MENKSVEDICELLKERGFPDAVMSSFKENDMDGDAIALGLASCPGPDWLKEIIPKAGQRFKVHRLLSSLCTDTELQSGVQDPSLFSPGSSSGNEAPFSPTPSTSSKVSTTPTSSVAGSVTPKTTPSLPSKIPSPFPIPRFRLNTETNFANKKMTDSDRKYVVQTLATMLMTYMQKPSMKHCGIVAKALIAKFPFLKDDDGDGEHSWKWFIYYRCQNVNRSSTKESSAKRPRLSSEDQTFHLYPPTEGEDEVSYGRNIELLKAEWGKQKPRAEVVKELLTHTFSNRFDTYVHKHEPPSLLEYLAEFPMLKKANYASLEFALCCKKDNLRQKFEEAFVLWSRAIITYCKETQVKSTALQIETAGYSEDSGVEECAVMALRCLALTIGSLKTKKLGSSIPYVLKVVNRETPPSEAVERGNGQPHIVLFCNDSDTDEETLKQYFIAVEGQLMMETMNLTTAIFLCLAAHYIFNLSYHAKTGDVFLFLQEKVLEIPSKAGVKRHPSSTSHFSGILREFESIKAQESDEMTDEQN